MGWGFSERAYRFHPVVMIVKLVVFTWRRESSEVHELHEAYLSSCRRKQLTITCPRFCGCIIQYQECLIIIILKVILSNHLVTILFLFKIIYIFLKE